MPRNCELVPDPADDYGVSINQAQRQGLAAFAELIRHWNRFANLVSRQDESRIEERHVRDSLSLVPVLEAPEGRLVNQVADVGSGAGLPGVPLAIALPGVQMTLIERSAKKSRFLRQVVMELGLPNVDVVCDDVVNVTEEFDAIVSRAVMAPERLWGLVEKNLRTGGRMAVLDRVEDTGDEPAVEADADFPGGSVVERRWSLMPASGALHGLLVVRCEAS